MLSRTTATEPHSGYLALVSTHKFFVKNFMAQDNTLLFIIYLFCKVNVPRLHHLSTHNKTHRYVAIVHSGVFN